MGDRGGKAAPPQGAWAFYTVMRDGEMPRRVWRKLPPRSAGTLCQSANSTLPILNSKPQAVPGKPVGSNVGLLSMKYGLLWGIVAYDFGGKVEDFLLGDQASQLSGLAFGFFAGAQGPLGLSQYEP